MIATDNDTIRALVLLATQDVNFDLIRDEILQNPNKSINDLLTNLRECDSSLAIRDSSHNEIEGDGVSYSHREVIFDKNTKLQYSDGDGKVSS